MLRDEGGRAIGLLCVNFDTSVLRGIERAVGELLGGRTLAEKPADLFRDDWHEKINLRIQQYLADRQTTLERLSREGRRELVRHLSREGAFRGRNAAHYVGRVLGLSRATVYNYLAKESHASAV